MSSDLFVRFLYVFAFFIMNEAISEGIIGGYKVSGKLRLIVNEWSALPMNEQGRPVESLPLDFDGEKWIISLYPFGDEALPGDDEETADLKKNTYGIYLKLIVKHAINASFKVRVLNENRQMDHVADAEVCAFDKRTCTWGFGTFQERSALECGGFKIDGRVIFEIDICTFRLSDNFSFNKNRSSDIVDLSGMLVSIEDTDVLICVQDKEFRAHSLILKHRSRYFKAIFSVPMIESSKMEIRESGIEAEVFEEVLRYLYTGAISERAYAEFCEYMLLASTKVSQNNGCHISIRYLR